MCLDTFTRKVWLENRFSFQWHEHAAASIGLHVTCSIRRKTDIDYKYESWRKLKDYWAKVKNVNEQKNERNSKWIHCTASDSNPWTGDWFTLDGDTLNNAISTPTHIKVSIDSTQQMKTMLKLKWSIESKNIANLYRKNSRISMTGWKGELLGTMQVITF